MAAAWQAPLDAAEQPATDLGPLAVIAADQAAGLVPTLVAITQAAARAAAELPQPPPLETWAWQRRHRWLDDERPGPTSLKSASGLLRPGAWLRYHVGDGSVIRLTSDQPLDAAQRSAIELASQRRLDDDGLRPRFGPSGSLPLRWLDERQAIAELPWPRPDALVVSSTGGDHPPLVIRIDQRCADPLAHGWQRLAWLLPQALAQGADPAPWLHALGHRADAVNRVFAGLPDDGLAAVPPAWRPAATAATQLDLRLALLADMPRDDRQWRDHPVAIHDPQAAPTIIAASAAAAVSGPAGAAAGIASLAARDGLQPVIWDRGRRADGQHYRAIDQKRPAQLLVSGPGLLELRHRPRFTVDDPQPYIAYHLGITIGDDQRSERHLNAPDIALGLDPAGLPVGHESISRIPIPPGTWRVVVDADRHCWLGARLRRRLPSLEHARSWTDQLTALAAQTRSETDDDTDPWSWWLRGLEHQRRFAPTAAAGAFARAAALIDETHPLAPVLPLLLAECDRQPATAPAISPDPHLLTRARQRCRLLRCLARPRDLEAARVAAETWLAADDDPAVHAALAALLRRWPTQERQDPRAVDHLLAALARRPGDADLEQALRAAWSWQAYWSESEPLELPAGQAYDTVWPIGRIVADRHHDHLARHLPQLLPATWQAWLRVEGPSLTLPRPGGELLLLRPPAAEPAALVISDDTAITAERACWSDRSRLPLDWHRDDTPLELVLPADTTAAFLRGPAQLAARLRHGSERPQAGPDQRPIVATTWQSERQQRLAPGQALRWTIEPAPGGDWLQLRCSVLEQLPADGLRLQLLADGQLVSTLRLDPARCRLPTLLDRAIGVDSRLQLSWEGRLPPGSRHLSLRCDEPAASALAVSLALRRSALRADPDDPPPNGRRRDEPAMQAPPPGSPLAPGAGYAIAERLRLLGLRLENEQASDRAGVYAERARVLAWLGADSAAQEDWRRAMAAASAADDEAAWIDAALDLQWSLAGWSSTDEATALLRQVRSHGVDGPRMQLRRAADHLRRGDPAALAAAHRLLLPLLDHPLLADRARLGCCFIAAARHDWPQLDALAQALVDLAPLDSPSWRAAVPLAALAQLRLERPTAAAARLEAATARLVAALPVDHERQTPERWLALAAAIRRLPELAAEDPSPAREEAVLALMDHDWALDPVATWTALPPTAFTAHGPLLRCQLGTATSQHLDYLPLGPEQTISLAVVGPARLRLALRTLHRSDGSPSRPLLVTAAIAGQEPLRWAVPPRDASPRWQLDDGSGLLVGGQLTRDIDIGPGRRTIRIAADGPAMLRISQRQAGAQLVPGPAAGDRWLALLAATVDDPARHQRIRAACNLPTSGEHSPALSSLAGDWNRLLAQPDASPDQQAQALLALGQAERARRLANDPLLRGRAILDHWFASWPTLLASDGPGAVHRALAELAALPPALTREPAAVWLQNSLGERCQRQNLLRLQGEVDQVDLSAPPAPPPDALGRWQASDLRNLLVTPSWQGDSVFLDAGISEHWDLELAATTAVQLRLVGLPRGAVAPDQGRLQLSIDGRIQAEQTITLAGEQRIALGALGPGRVRISLRCDFPDHAWYLRQGLLTDRPVVADAHRVTTPEGERFAVPRPIRIAPYRIEAGETVVFEVVGPNRLHLTSRAHDGGDQRYHLRLDDGNDNVIAEQTVAVPARRSQVWTSQRNGSEIPLGESHRQTVPLIDQRRYRVSLTNQADGLLYLAPSYDVVDLQRRPPQPAAAPSHQPRLPPREAHAPTIDLPPDTPLSVRQRGTWSAAAELRLNEVAEPKADDSFQDQLVATIGWQRRFDIGLWLGASIDARQLFDEDATATDLELRLAQPLWSGGLVEARVRNHTQRSPFLANSHDAVLRLGHKWRLRDDISLRGEIELGSWSSNIEARAALAPAYRDRVVYEVFNDYRASHDRWLNLRFTGVWRIWQDCWAEARGTWTTNPSLQIDDPDRFRLDGRLHGWRAGIEWEAGTEYLQRIRDDRRRTYSYEITAYAKATWHGWHDASLWRPWIDLRGLLRQQGVVLRTGIEWWFGGERDQPYHDWAPGLDFAERQHWRWYDRTGP